MRGQPELSRAFLGERHDALESIKRVVDLETAEEPARRIGRRRRNQQVRGHRFFRESP